MLKVRKFWIFMLSKRTTKIVYMLSLSQSLQSANNVPEPANGSKTL
jgi:hypothetical protein